MKSEGAVFWNEDQLFCNELELRRLVEAWGINNPSLWGCNRDIEHEVRR